MHGGHILLVDDESYLLQAIAEFLSEQGYIVDAVETPMAALELLDQRIFDLVVTDYRLPELSGIKLLGRVKEKDPQIEVIIITGYGSKESVLEALRLGAYDFIEKPFDTVELLKSIANCLETIRLKTRIDGLVEDLHQNQRKLERAIIGRDHELEQKGHCLDRVEGVVERLESVASEIGQSNSKIWDDMTVCRKRRQSYLADVSRLISTCAREARQITTSVSGLEMMVQEMESGIREQMALRTASRRIPEESPGVVADPAEEPDEPVLDAALAEIDDQETDEIYEGMQQFVAQLFSDIAAGTDVDIQPGKDLLSRIIPKEGVLDSLYRKAIYSGVTPDQWDLAAAVVVHSANVAVYALKLGEGLGFDASRLAGLGIAALVHDVGMASLPPEIYAKEELDDADREGLRQHPLHGLEFLSQLAEQDSWLAEVAAQEHEREDGSGYPHGLKGRQIREEAKVIGLVDTYAGLTRSRPSRRGLAPFEAVKEITQTYRLKFHSSILRAMLHKLSAFPIGSLVRLNSGTIGQVVETDEAYPLRPEIRPLFDGDDRPIATAQTLSLRDNPILHVSGVVYAEDLQRMKA